jgi:NADPH:quinone reductase-like Zn-dependent oxidoreductase
MKAVRYHEYGATDVLRYEQIERPEPRAGEVLLRVAGAAFNPIDAWIRAGQLIDLFPVSLPHTPGIDVSGTVITLGDGVEHPAVGGAVIGLLPIPSGGAMAEFTIAPAEVLTSAPTSVPLADAAALPVAALTAWQALFEHAHVKAGQRVLINGAGGGVGGFAVQLAKQAGATVIATASPRSESLIRSYEPDQIVDYRSTRLADAITEPVDVLINLVVVVDPSEMATLIALTRPGGRLVTATAPPADDPTSRVRIVFFSVRSDPHQLASIVEQVDAGTLRIDISARRSLSQAKRLHEQYAEGLTRGRVLLVPED